MRAQAVTTKQALRFIERHGIVLESGRGSAPSLLTEAFGATSTGSWWGHPKARQFFWLTRALRESPQVLVCRLLGGKITYVHRRLWPALIQRSEQIGRDRLTRIHEVHTPSGKHMIEETPFPNWVPADVRAAARQPIPDETTRELDRFAQRADAAAAVPQRTSRAGRASRDSPERSGRRRSRSRR